jgi:hypothetical protein
LAAWASWLGSGNLTTKRSFLPPDRDVAIFGRALNYFISYYDRSAAKWRLWFDWKERAQDRECLRCKHNGNQYKHCCEFHARRSYQNRSPFIIFSEICRPKFSKLFRSWKNPDSGLACDCTAVEQRYFVLYFVLSLVPSYLYRGERRGQISEC